MTETAERTDTPAPGQHGAAKSALLIGDLGVVFGDIGTSPIYTIQTVVNPDDPHPVPTTTDNVYGFVSLIFWAALAAADGGDDRGKGCRLARFRKCRRDIGPVVPMRAGRTALGGQPTAC